MSRVTTLVGRNESGKTNLLLALHSLNPPDGLKDVSTIKDFPRHRRISECKPDPAVVDTTWELTPAQQTKLASIFARAKAVSRVQIGRAYKAGNRSIEFAELPPLVFDLAAAMQKFENAKGPILEAAEKLEPASKAQLEAAVASVEKVGTQEKEALEWATTANGPLIALLQTLASTKAGLALQTADKARIEELAEFAEGIVSDDKASLEARKWAIALLPIFVYVDEYPELDGHQNITEYLHRKQTPNTRTTADLNFEKLCKVADLNPQELHDLLAKNDHETRNQLANRAGAVVAGEIRRLWKDRPLKVRFNPDAAHLDTLLSDPNALYDVEVNLDELLFSPNGSPSVPSEGPVS